jgi:pilus assembly protein CpaB
MRFGTVAGLAGSAVLGVGALIVARVWLPAQQVRSVANAEEPVRGVPVVVAATAIPYGAKLEAKFLTVAHLPQNVAPQGAYGSVNDILGQTGGAPVALIPMALHEPVLPSKLSGPGARATIAAVIGEGMRAYTIGVSEVAGGGGHVMPADRVDVVLTRDVGVPGPDAASSKRLVTDVVLQNIRVLGMDLNADPTSTHPAAPRTATLEVDMQGAEKLALASQAGTLSLALRRTGSSEVDATRSVSVAQLGPVGLPQYAPVPLKRRPPAPPRDGVHAEGGGSSVVVVSGAKSDTVKVPSERTGL